MTLSEVIDYINMEEVPTADECKRKFSHITIGDELKALRKEYRKRFKIKKGIQIESLFNSDTTI